MEINKKRIAILGSTGSIGKQAIEVVLENPDFLEISVLTAHSNAGLLIQQALAVKPNVVVICNENEYQKVNDALFSEGIKVYAGEDSLSQVVEMDEIDLVLTAIVGFAGLRSTLSSIEAGKTIALANKETLVVAGDIITQAAQKKGVNIYPVDSEHSAIFQCLIGEFHNPLEKIYLTASGGPFRGKTSGYLASVTKEQALKHPNWSMGRKITVDSATLMNKGLEVIEAKWLFGLKPEQIDVIIHPQSIIHSLVQFKDGSIKAQLGLPDMKLPIQFAFSYPNRLPNKFPRFSFLDYPELTFEQPDPKTFRNLALAFDAMEKGGNLPCIMNAANEIAVDAFLHDRLRFLEIAEIIEETMAKAFYIKNPTIEDYFETDRESRQITKQLLSK
jgi:1-deoxy-D-xylulose-5-phosphate reductoisomerase